ncbi:unnamed protein product [Wickerhamomyces anomalus]
MRLLRIPSQILSKKVTSLAIDSNSKTLACGCADGQILLWDLKTLLEVTSLTNPTLEDIKRAEPFAEISKEAGITCLKFHGDWLISADESGDVFKIDCNSSSLDSHLLFKTQSDINDIENFNELVLFATLNKILAFDLKTNKEVESIPSRSDVRTLSIDPTNCFLTSIGFNRQISIHQINYIDGQLLSKKIPTGPQQLISINEVCKISWSPTGESFAVPNYGVDPQTNGIGVVSRTNWRVQYSLYGHNCNVVRYCPCLYQAQHDKPVNIIASSGIDKSIAVWNTTHQRPLFTASDVSEKSINDLVWTNDGSGLFAATDSILIFQFDKGELGHLESTDKLNEVLSKIPKPEPLKPKEKPIELPKVEEKVQPTNGTKPESNNKPQETTPSVPPTEPKPTPKIIPTKTKDGKKRIAPTLISAVNGSKPVTTQPLVTRDTNGHGALTTMEFDVPSYSAPKELKRKEDFDPEQPQKKRREIEAVEFIGSVVINPSTSFAKVRISTPKIRSFFTIKSPNDETLSLDIRNGSGNEQKPTRITLLKNETKQIFVDFIPKLAGLATGGEGEFWAVSTTDGVLYVYSDSGRRIFPPIVLGTPLSFLESKGKYLLAVTSIGEVFAWDVAAKKALFEPASLYPLLSRSNPDLLTRAENLTLCGISSSGTPIVTLSNGSGYLFDRDMETWTLVSDSWWAFGSQYWDSRDEKTNGGNIVNLLERKTNDEIVRRGRGKFLQKMAKTMLMKEGYENLEKIISLAHLENRILISKKLNEKTEFKNYLIIYCKRISEMDYKAKLIEIFQELLGPQSENKGEWDSKICSFDKHDLLKEIIFACANIRSVQRILIEFATSLGILDQIAL